MLSPLVRIRRYPNLKELIAVAKKDPGKLTYSSCGPGTLCHLSGELFKSLTGTDLLHVPFKGSAPAMNALIGNQVNLAFDTLTVLAPQIKDGKVKGLAVTSRERSPLLPNVPTAAEAGVSDFVVIPGSASSFPPQRRQVLFSA